MSKPRRQEQERAQHDVREVAPGVLRMQLPIWMPGLGHVNCYALVDRDGATLVDPGLPGRRNWRALADRLKQADLHPRNVHTVIVTHSHPDHFGGSGRLARETGARVIAHRDFSLGWMRPSSTPEVSVDDLAAQREVAAQREAQASDPEHAEPKSAPARTAAARPRWGGPAPWGGTGPRPPWRSRLRYRLMGFAGGRFAPAISHPTDDGQVLRLAGREWRVLHTPGHTADHICLHDQDLGIFLAGDHVLPTITPHISGLSPAADPLAAFFESLDRVGEIRGVKQVLPAHGHPFEDLHARTEAIKRHHHERLERVREIGRALGRGTVEEFSRQLFKPASQGPMADSETYAHLEHLRLARQAERFEGPEGRLLYETG